MVNKRCWRCERAAAAGEDVRWRTGELRGGSGGGDGGRRVAGRCPAVPGCGGVVLGGRAEAEAAEGGRGTRRRRASSVCGRSGAAAAQSGRQGLRVADADEDAITDGGVIARRPRHR